MPSNIRLLDVNVLLALFDANHVAHEITHNWFELQSNLKWATCPITENGFVRIASNPKYTNIECTTNDAIARLAEFTTSTDHTFWPDSLSVTNKRVSILKKQISPKQLTDIYLIALASKNKGKLATLDKRLANAFKNEPIELIE